MITKTSLHAHQSVNGASFLTKNLARAAKMDLAARHLCLLSGCAGLLGLGPRFFFFCTYGVTKKYKDTAILQN